MDEDDKTIEVGYQPQSRIYWAVTPDGEKFETFDFMEMKGYIDEYFADN